MAKISKTEEQEQALRDVAAGLKILRKLKEFSDKADQKYSLVVTANSVDGESVRCAFTPDDTIIIDFLKDYKKRLIKRVAKTGADFRIEFDDSEKILLSIDKPQGE